MFGAEYAWLVAGMPPRIRGPAPCARTQLARALEGLVTVTAHRGIVGDGTSFSGLVRFLAQSFRYSSRTVYYYNF